MSRSDRATPSQTALLLAGLAFALSLLLRQVPFLAWSVYPFQLFVTLVHELSHGLAALLTGGRFLRFTIASDTSGLATTAGGWRWLVISAGYIGAALFGGGMLVLTNRSSGIRERRWLSVGLGVSFVLTTALYARNLTSIAVGSLTGLALIALGWYGPRLLLTFCLNLLAIQCGLNALDSLIGLVHASAGPFPLPNDAQAMASLTHIPSLMWATLWSLMAIGVLAGSVTLSVRRARRI